MQGNRAEVAALALIRSAVAELIAQPAAGASPCADNNCTTEEENWKQFYGSEYPQITVLHLAGYKDHDPTIRNVKDATDRLEQEFVARYRTVPVTSTN